MIESRLSECRPRTHKVAVEFNSLNVKRDHERPIVSCRFSCILLYTVYVDGPLRSRRLSLEEREIKVKARRAQASVSSLLHFRLSAMHQKMGRGHNAWTIEIFRLRETRRTVAEQVTELFTELVRVFVQLSLLEYLSRRVHVFSLSLSLSNKKIFRYFSLGVQLTNLRTDWRHEGH